MEAQLEFVRGAGLHGFYMNGFKSMVDLMKQDLLTNVHLDESIRKGYVIALQKIKEGFVEAITKADLPVPQWIEDEII